MNEGTNRTNALRDEALPLLPAMLGDEAAGLLEAVTGLAGATVQDWRIGQVNWQPGASLTVRYDATLLRSDGMQTVESIVATTGGRSPAGALQVERDGASLAAWLVPDDPALPALATALSPAGARRLLDAVHAPKGNVTTRLRAYRPGRRAVVQVTGEGIDAYVKVVRPSRIEVLQQAHVLSAEHLPVPHSFGWSSEGVIVLRALAGMTFRDALARPGIPLPPAAAVGSLLDHLPERAELRAVDPVVSAAEHARMLSRLLPDQRWRLDALIAGMRQLPVDEPLVPVHGDLYEAQLMTDGAGNLTGMLDIDTLAMGHRVDDWANFIGHLAAWEPMSPDPQRVRNYAREILALGDEQSDPARLRERVAATLIGLATGPFRVQQEDWPAETRRRLALAGDWMASAERVARHRAPALA